MNNSFSKLTYKNFEFAQESQKPQGPMSEDLFVHSGRRIAAYKPSSLTICSNLYYFPSSVSKSINVRWLGSTWKSPGRYPAEVAELANPLAVNMIVLGGGEANAIETESGITDPGLADLRQIGRVLALDYTLETLLLLADLGPTELAQLTEQLIPQDRIVKTIAELHSNQLVEIKENIISPTPKALKISALLREKLNNTPS